MNKIKIKAIKIVRNKGKVVGRKDNSKRRFGFSSAARVVDASIQGVEKRSNFPENGSSGVGGMPLKAFDSFSKVVSLEAVKEDKYYTDNEAKDWSRCQETAIAVVCGENGKVIDFSRMDESYFTKKVQDEAGVERQERITEGLSAVLSEQGFEGNQFSASIAKLMVRGKVDFAMQSILGNAMSLQYEERPNMLVATTDAAAKMDIFVMTKEKGVELFSIMASTQVFSDKGPCAYDENGIKVMQGMDTEGKSKALTQKLREHLGKMEPEAMHIWLTDLVSNGASLDDWDTLNTFGYENQIAAFMVGSLTLGNNGIPEVSTRSETSPILERQVKFREAYQRIEGVEASYASDQLPERLRDIIFDKYMDIFKKGFPEGSAELNIITKGKNDSVEDFVYNLVENDIESYMKNEMTVEELSIGLEERAVSRVSHIKNLIHKDESFTLELFDDDSLTARVVAEQIFTDESDVSDSEDLDLENLPKFGK